MSDLKPITRKEKIISGEDLVPITREEMFLQKYRGSGGGGGGTGGAIPDWNQNDETAPDYVKNRTHYIIPATSVATNTLTFDGNIEGKEVLGGEFVKMSDGVITANDLIGATVVFSAGGEEMSATLTADDIQDMTAEGIPQIAIVPTSFEYGLPAIMIFTEELSAEGVTATKGIYFICGEEEGVKLFTKSLTCLTDCFVTGTPEVVEPFDGKFLPKGLGYIKEGGAPVEIFPETSVEFTEEGGMWGVFVEGAFPLECGKTYTVKWGGVEYACVAQDASDVMEAPAGSSLVALGDLTSMGLSGKGEPFVFVAIHIEDEGQLIEQAMITSFNEVTSLAVGVYESASAEVKKIDNRLLDVEWLAVKKAVEVEVVPEMSVELKLIGGVVRTNVYEGDELYLALEAGKTYKVYFDGKPYICTAKTTELDGIPIPCTYIGNGKFNDLPDTGEPFTYYGTPPLAVLATDFTEDTTVTIRITTEGKAPDKLPEEYLPETLLATIADLTARITELEGATE